MSKSTLQRWLDFAITEICDDRGGFWSGARLIKHHRRFTLPRIDQSIQLEMFGYTQSKMSLLVKAYLVQDQVDAAMKLHQRNIDRRKYASSGFTFANHLFKTHSGEKTSKRGSVMGPCLIGAVLTLRPHEKRCTLDIMYRTTEVLKKFPADLIFLRDHILPQIPGTDQYPCNEINFNFVNFTAHPQYAAMFMPYVPDAVATMELIRARNPAWWVWAGKWLGRYLIGGAAARSIEKFSQALAVARSSQKLLAGPVGDSLVCYLYHNRASFIPTKTRFKTDDLEQAFRNAYERVTAP